MCVVKDEKWNYIEEAVQKVLNETGYADTLGLDTVGLAKRLGFEVYKSSPRLGGKWYRTALVVDNRSHKGEKYIASNVEVDLDDQRFCIIREVGYYLLNYNGQKRFGHLCDEEDDVESVLFASAFLMQEDKFILGFKKASERYQYLDEIFSELSKVFRVPWKYVVNRAQYLGLIEMK